MSKEIFNRIVEMGVRMVLDCTPVSMAVSVLAQTNGLDNKQAERLNKAIVNLVK